MDFVTWAGAVAGIGAMIGMATFWMRIGAWLNKSDSAAAIGQVALAKADLASAQLHEYRAEAASEFATKGDLTASKRDLAEAERRFATACDALSARFDRMAERLDRVLETIVDRRHER